MAQRKRIGLIFSYDEEWIAGTYYILNIIHALKTLPSARKPIIVIITDALSNYKIVKKETQYPHLEYIIIPIQAPKYSTFERLVNKIAFIFGVKKLINKKPKKANVDFIYPFQINDISERPVKKVNWVPDFQEVHLPHLFSEETIADRKKLQKEVISKGDWVVFSSQDAKADFNLLYPNARVEQFVLPFAVTHPKHDHLSLKKLLIKYKLPPTFYFAPNQFWKHKNHIIILKAMNFLKQNNVIVHVAFSGKEKDHRNLNYVNELKAYIDESGLNSQVHFLGFIPRDEQLFLMKHSRAIIQPSLFEGWSTVVEDAKALNKFIIVSDLAVHREQIIKNAVFFEGNDYNRLAELLKTYWQTEPNVSAISYMDDVKDFANNFINLVYKVG